MHHNTAKAHNLHIQEDERIIMVVRKHWFVLKIAMLGPLLIGIIGFIIIQALGSAFSEAFTAFASALWLLGIWMLIFTIWTNYYLDAWVITDKRIIDIDQQYLFSRSTSTIRVERVQDARVEVEGIFATVFGYGNLRIQTAGADSEFILIEGIPNPAAVKNAIMEFVDIAVDEGRITA